MTKLGIGSRETLRKWVRQDQIDSGALLRQAVPSPRAMRDEELKVLIQEVFASNYRVYGPPWQPRSE